MKFMATAPGDYVHFKAHVPLHQISLETLSREDLASRLTLNTAVASIGRLLLTDNAITIMDTNDYCAIPQRLKDQLAERYSGARRAFLKTGGDFPFLSRPDEVNLHLQLHLRRVGIEGRPDLIKGPLRRDDAGNSKERNDDTKDSDDSWKDNGSSPNNLEDGSAPNESASSSYDIDEQLAASTTKVVKLVPMTAKHYLTIYPYGAFVELGTYLILLRLLVEILAYGMVSSSVSCKLYYTPGLEPRFVLHL